MKKLTDSQKGWLCILVLQFCAAFVFVVCLLDRNVIGVILSAASVAYYCSLLYRRYDSDWRGKAADLEWEVYASPEGGRNPYSITEVRYRRLHTFGNYENEAVEMAARVWPGDDPDDVLAALKGQVEAKLREAGVVAQKHEEIFDLDRQIADQRNTLRQATERAEKAKAFLKEHGIELYADVPF